MSKQNNVSIYLKISGSNFCDLDFCGQEYQEFKRAWKQAMRKQEIERIKVVQTRDDLICYSEVGGEWYVSMVLFII